MKTRVAPLKRHLIVDTRESMHAIRLPLGARIGIAPGIVVQQVAVVRAGLRFFYLATATNRDHLVRSWSWATPPDSTDMRRRTEPKL